LSPTRLPFRHSGAIQETIDFIAVISTQQLLYIIPLIRKKSRKRGRNLYRNPDLSRRKTEKPPKNRRLIANKIHL